MNQEEDLITPDFLQRSGFEKTSRPGWVTWFFSDSKIDNQEKSDKKVQTKKPLNAPLWSIKSVEVTERKGSYQLAKMDLRLDNARFRENIVRAARKFYGARTTATIVDCEKGSFWVLLEFVKSGAKKNQLRQNASDYLPYGVAGFKVGIGGSGNAIEFYFSDFFGIGFIPQVFVSAHMRILIEALNIRKVAERNPGMFEQKSLFEFQIAQEVVLAMASGELDLPKSLISDRNRQSSLGVAFKDAHISFQLGAEERPQDFLQRVATPVVVLESREGSEIMRAIDALLLSGKVSKGCRSIVDMTRTGVVAPFFLRRLSLLSVCGYELRDEIVNAHLDGSRVEQTLFLSHKVRSAALNDDAKGILDSLSELGKVLVRDVPDIESVKSFDLVVPELLGDAWCPTNPRKAEACYERILQRCGDLPRILRKMITIAKIDSNHVREYALLYRLSMVERRRNELARIFLRLAELTKNHNDITGDPLGYAFKSLQNDKNHYQSVLLAAELLNENDKPNEAIALLDQTLADPTINIPHKAKARLEYAIGTTWQQSLKRTDLAERRFERAVALDANHIESLSRLETIYRETGQSDKIGALLEKQFDAFERSGDLENLKRIFEELVELYRGPMGQPKKGYELYQRMLALAIVEPEEIDRLMAWRDIEIDWSTIYQKLVTNLANLPSGEVTARYHIRLAEICRDKIDNPKGAFSHYLAALDHGGIDSNGFRMIIEKLASDQDYDRLTECFEKRLKQTSERERVELIVEIMSFPGVMSDPRRDQLAVEAFVLDESKSGILFQRIKFYQSMDDVDGLERFATVVSDFVKAPLKVCSWIRNIIESLQECIDPTKLRAIDKLYRKLYEVDSDPASVLVEAINLFKTTMDAGRCGFYIRELLKIDEIPMLSPKLVARYLSGFDADLAKYHYLKALSANRSDGISADARVANTIYKKLPGHHKMQEKSLHLLGMHELLTEVDQRDLFSLAGITENWVDAVKVLQKQTDLTTDPVKKGKLLLDQGVMLWKEMRDTGRARLAYVMALNYVERKAPIKMTLAQLARDAGQKEQESRALVDFLLDGESSTDLPVYVDAVARMMALGKEPYSVYKLIKPRLTELAEDSGSSVLKIAETLISAGLLNQELFLMSFRSAVFSRQVDDAVDYWWRGLRSVQNRAGIKAYLSETKALLESTEREDLMLKCYRAAIQNGVTTELPEKVKQEVLIQYGLILFDSDLRRNKALPVFTEAFKSDRTDNRTWLPIYFILEEQGDISQQYRFLKEMIVLLRQDTRPLRQYPITIESLEMQLRELENQVGKRGGTGSFVSSADARDINVDNTISRLHTIPDVESIRESVEEEAPSVSPVQEGDAIDGNENDAVEQIPISMVSGDSVANVEIPVPKDPHLSLAAQPEAFSSAPSMPDISLEVPPSGGESVASNRVEVSFSGTDDNTTTIDFSLDSPLPSHEPEAENAHGENPDNVLDLGFVPMGGLADGDDPANLENPAIDLPDLSDQGVGFSLDDLPQPNADAPQFAEEPVSMVIDFNDSSDANEGFAPTGIELPDLSTPEYSGIEAVIPDFSLDEQPGSLPPPPVDMNQSMSVPDFSLEGLGDDSQVGLIPAPPFTDRVPPEVPTALPSESEPEVEEKLFLNPEASNFRGEEVSSVELAAALDIKKVLPEDEYSSPDLSASVSLLRDAASNSVSGMPSLPREDSAQGSIRKVNAGLEDAHPNSLEAADWRSAILSGDVPSDLTERLKHQAFANEVEKHLALQCVALISGHCDLLNNWHWRVWRNSKEYGYQLNGRERFNSEYTSPALQSTLHQFVIACNPLFAKVFRERYTIDHLAKLLGTNVQTIDKHKKQVSWQKGILNDVGFHLYTERIAKRGYRAFNLPGLSAHIFFEGPKKTVYFDEAYFTKQPPGALFHRILSLLWSIRLQYFIPLALDPKKQVFPLLAELHQKLEVQGISKLAEKMKSRSPLAKHLATFDLRTLQSLKAKSGVPSEAQVVGLWHSMQEHIFKLILSETLDVIGLFEAILSKDLTKNTSLKPKEILSASSYTKALLEFATRLVL